MSFEVIPDSGFLKAHRLFGPSMKFKEAVNQAHKAALQQAGEIVLKEIKAGYSGRRRRKGWPRLHPFTIEEKGSNKPLHDTGRLASSVQLGSERGDLVVGFSDKETAMIAQVHEDGTTIRVSPRMRGFLAARGLHLRKTTETLVIPPRPNIGPAFRRSRRKMQRAFSEGVRREIDART